MSPGSAGPLRELADLRGQALVSGVLNLVARRRPVHLSIVGGEPLVRYKEIGALLPQLARLRVNVQIVTSGVRPIPRDWSRFPNLQLVVSIDGLAPEHDKRRAPATYQRILKNIAGRRLTVHCTVTRQQVQRPDYLREFAMFWAVRPEIERVWFSLYTPQRGDCSAERLRSEDRHAAIQQLRALRDSIDKVEMPEAVLRGYADPPASPQQCIFAQVTECVSADLHTRVMPCQFGGHPVCTECGCMASAGLKAVATHKVAGLVPLSSLFETIQGIGSMFHGSS